MDSHFHHFYDFLCGKSRKSLFTSPLPSPIRAASHPLSFTAPHTIPKHASHPDSDYSQRQSTRLNRQDPTLRRSSCRRHRSDPNLPRHRIHSLPQSEQQGALEAPPRTRRRLCQRAGTHLDKHITACALDINVQPTPYTTNFERASSAVSAACCFKPNRNFAPLCHRTVASRSPTHTSARYTSMSLFTSNSTPIPGSFRKRQSVPETVIILIIVTAVGLSVVVGFVLFVIWFRMKKRREQHEAAIQLEELTHTGNSLGRPAEHEIGVAR
ncbi:hypothetical protein PTTW11_01257 [Pyrenophora teres f. teres]|uniref:Uncharacterized protein n=1 Tax=Pyrenophora teres f. teres TaxID=97479 RepID=A0A6S6VEA4_9PLEO|nr:hypothetical protein PTTW11_01257 [Pyrenophora teres f. teres]